MIKDIKDLCQYSLEEVLENCTLVDEIVGHETIRGITNWILKPEIMLEYDSSWTRPELPIQRGSCWVLLKLNLEAGILRPAMILPLIWKDTEAESDKRLPKGLVELAEKVKETIGGENIAQWTLHPGFDSCPDISDWMSGEDSRSAWFALYAGLRLAIDELMPNPKVFASGAWENGVQRVEGLEEKAQVAKEWGAGFFYIPEQCELTGDDPDFIRKVRNDAKLEKALSDYLSELADEPKEEDISKNPALVDRYYAYIKQAGKNEKAQQFYIKRITPYLVDQSQKSPDNREKIEQYQNGTLVAWVSGGWEVILNDAQIFDVSKVILLLDGHRFENAANTLKNILQEKNKKVEIQQAHPVFKENHWTLDIGTDFLFGNNTGMILDLTLGSVLMSLVLWSIPNIHPLFLYWEKQVDKNNNPIPGSSKVRAWNEKNSV